MKLRPRFTSEGASTRLRPQELQAESEFASIALRAVCLTNEVKQPASEARVSREVVQEVSQSRYVKAGTAIPADHVLTPGGYRNKSLVHRVAPGHAVTHEAGKSLTLDLSTKAVTEVPPEETKSLGVPSPGSGWITYASWANTTGKPISLFTTSWVVPQAPATQSGQTIFIFNGLADSARNDIVQPVLQWGVGAQGGGNYWAVANWYVDPSGNAYYSSLVPVQEGDVLVGRIALTDQSEASFSYRTEFEGIAGTALPVLNVAELSVASETLEAYQISACSDYPNAPSTSMTSIDLRTNGSPAPLVWMATNKVVDCGQKTTIVNNANPGGQVDIVY